MTSPAIFQALAIKHGLKMWRDLKMKPNTAWPPRAMMRTAMRITGEDFAPRDYTGAIKALEKWLLEAQAKERANG